MLYASPDYLRRRGVPSHPSELASHDCLLYLRDGGAATWVFEREGERVSVPVAGAFKANNSEVLREAAQGGLGVGLLPDFSARPERGPAGRLMPVLPQWKPFGFFGERIYALRPWSAQVPRAVQCLVDHLRSSLSAGFSSPSLPSFPSSVGGERQRTPTAAASSTALLGFAGARHQPTMRVDFHGSHSSSIQALRRAPAVNPKEPTCKFNRTCSSKVAAKKRSSSTAARWAPRSRC
jgi:hypothetical protein